MSIIPRPSNCAWAQTGVLGLLAMEHILHNKGFDVNIIQMAESVSLMTVILFRVNNAWITSVDYIFNEVRRIINLCKLVLTVNSCIFLL